MHQKEMRLGNEQRMDEKANSLPIQKIYFQKKL